MGWEKELALATKAADGAGAYLRSVFGKKQKVLHLDARDVKLEADIHAEEIILAVLDETGLPVLAEESGEHLLENTHRELLGRSRRSSRARQMGRR